MALAANPQLQATNNSEGGNRVQSHIAMYLSCCDPREQAQTFRVSCRSEIWQYFVFPDGAVWATEECSKPSCLQPMTHTEGPLLVLPHEIAEHTWPPSEAFH